jgi:hypothetical protein
VAPQCRRRGATSSEEEEPLTGISLPLPLADRDDTALAALAAAIRYRSVCSGAWLVRRASGSSSAGTSAALVGATDGAAVGTA